MSVRAPSDPPKPAKGLPRPFVGLCLAVGALVGAYCVLTLVSLATASTEHRSRTFAMAAGALRVEAGSSDVRIVGEARRDVRVDMDIQRGMFRNGFQPHVAMRRSGRTLQLRSHCSVMAHIGVGDCGASFTVRVPRGVPLTVGASSGDVRVEDLVASLRLATSSGDVDVEGYGGHRLDVRAHSGDIDLTAFRVPWLVRAEADAGDIDVAVPDALYSVSVQTGSGDQDVQVNEDPRAPRVIQAKTSSGDVRIAPLGDRP